MNDMIFNINKLKKKIKKNHYKLLKQLIKKKYNNLCQIPYVNTISIKLFFHYFQNVDIIHYSDFSLVFTCKRYIYKFIFGVPQFLRENELFYSFFFDKHDLYVDSLSNYCSTLLIMNRTFDDPDISPKNHSTLLQHLVIQIIDFHTHFNVHNDIKLQNIISFRKFWCIIDYGLMKKYHPENIQKLDFNSGTLKCNIPNYKTSVLNSLSDRDKVFWMYMKDWYGLATIVSKYSFTFSRLLLYIDSMDKAKVIDTLKKTVPLKYQKHIYYFNENSNQKIKHKNLPTV